jgi:hypothetical protein
MMNRRYTRVLILVGVAAASAACVLGLLVARPPASSAAEPGSKDDPLATVGYVEKFAQYNSVTLPARQSLRVGKGTEFVINSAAQNTLTTSEFKPLHDELLDLSEGAPVLVEELQVYHHYLNASSHDIFLRFDSETTLMIRGSWK